MYLKFVLMMMLAVNVCAYELKKEYLLTDYQLYSTDLFPEIPKKFELLRLHENDPLQRINSEILKKAFISNGYELDIQKAPFVNFILQSTLNFSELETQIRDSYISRYPNISISKIIVSPRGNLSKLPQHSIAYFDKHTFDKPHGTFYILDAQGIRRYLDYRINAILPVMHTTQNVLRNDLINGLNATQKDLEFRAFSSTPLTIPPEKPYRFRTHMKANSIIFERNIELLPLVTKKGKIIAEIKNGSVIVEIVVTATQEGSLYDIITIQKSDGKRAKAKVIGENRVELL